MTATPQAAALAPPAVHLIDSECEALTALALGIEHTQPGLAELLLTELERAELHPINDLPADTVAMNSVIDFVDEGNGTQRTVQLVYPPDADIETGRISILTPIGAGLIGLSTGDAIVWPDRLGHERRLRIVSVRAQDLT
ncbi:MAG: nucleoside diphosphate kinase regulator [Sphingomonas sp.]